MPATGWHYKPYESQDGGWNSYDSQCSDSSWWQHGSGGWSHGNWCTGNSESDDRYAELRKQYDQLASENEELRKQCAAVHADHGELRKQSAEVAADREELRKQYAAVTAERDVLRKWYTQCRQDFMKHIERYDELRVEHEKLRLQSWALALRNPFLQ